MWWSAGRGDSSGGVGGSVSSASGGSGLDHDRFVLSSGRLPRLLAPVRAGELIQISSTPPLWMGLMTSNCISFAQIPNWIEMLLYLNSEVSL